MERLLGALLLLAGLLGLGDVPSASAEPEAFPGEDGLIAFTSVRDGNGEIYVMGADGSNPTNLTNHPASDSRPAWSADGNRIAFDTGRDGNREIYTMAADGSNAVNLSNDPGEDYQPTWSPDGTRIAFDSTRDGDEDIFVMGADGSNPTNLTPSAGTDFSAAWSPDGTRIAFASNRTGDSEVYVMNPDGTGLVNLTNHPADDGQPAWTPDGTRLLFASSRGGDDNDIWVMDADGTDPRSLTDDPADDVTPEASPSGELLVFSSERNGATGDPQIYSLDGSGAATNLTNTGTGEHYPDWQPSPSGPLPVIRPDARIARGPGPFAGNDVYNTTGAGQARSGSAARGRTVTYWVAVDNDGNVPQTYTVKGGQPSRHFNVQYVVGNRNRTGPVIDGLSWRLAVAQSRTLRVVVTVRNSAPANASLSRFVTITSQDDPTIIDRVKFTTRRS